MTLVGRKRIAYEFTMHMSFRLRASRFRLYDQPQLLRKKGSNNIWLRVSCILRSPVAVLKPQLWPPGYAECKSMIGVSDLGAKRNLESAFSAI